VAGGLEELADVADAPVDGEGCDAEEPDDGGLREAESLVEQDGE
jgi:hypothetical protein